MRTIFERNSSFQNWSFKAIKWNRNIIFNRSLKLYFYWLRIIFDREAIKNFGSHEEMIISSDFHVLKSTTLKMFSVLELWNSNIRFSIYFPSNQYDKKTLKRNVWVFKLSEIHSLRNSATLVFSMHRWSSSTSSSIIESSRLLRYYFFHETSEPTNQICKSRSILRFWSWSNRTAFFFCFIIANQYYLLR